VTKNGHDENSEPYRVCMLFGSYIFFLKTQQLKAFGITPGVRDELDMRAKATRPLIVIYHANSKLRVCWRRRRCQKL